MRNPIRWLGACLWVVGGLACAAPPATEGRVVRVIDGDSVVVARASGAPVEVRLLGIDAPEGCQDGGAQARAALEERVGGRAVVLRPQGRDTYGRMLATLVVDGEDVNAWLVVEGHAWSERWKWDHGPYVKQERVAIALRRGLHATPGAVMPRAFRASHGPCGAEQPQPPPSALRCDGRTYCSQMTSCEEARFFLANCPGARMDGDRNGIPCERQWCR